MTLHTTANLLRLALRSEALIAEIRLRAYGRKLVLVICAAVFAIMALGFLNLTLYHWLELTWGPVWAPLILAAANLVLTAMAIGAGLSVKPGPELQVAEDLRKLATSSLEDELRSATSLGGLIGSLAGGRDSSAAARLLIPAVVSIIGALHSRKRPAAAKKAD